MLGDRQSKRHHGLGGHKLSLLNHQYIEHVINWNRNLHWGENTSEASIPIHFATLLNLTKSFFFSKNVQLIVFLIIISEDFLKVSHHNVQFNFSSCKLRLPFPTLHYSTISFHQHYTQNSRNLHINLCSYTNYFAFSLRMHLTLKTWLAHVL